MKKEKLTLEELKMKIRAHHQRKLREDLNGYDEEDFFPETSTELAVTEDLNGYDEEDFDLFSSEDVEEDIDETGDMPLTEDLTSSFPVKLLDESQVRSTAKVVVKGAKVAFGYVKELKLDAKYAQGKFVKKENKQYPLVKALKVTEGRGCTGVQYDRTEGARALHNTKEYQDKLADKIARTGSGFGTNVHDSEAGLENILVTTSSGKKCVLVYPLSTMRAKNRFYISVDGEDWRETDKKEIAQYMSAGEAQKFLDPSINAEKRAGYQATIYNRNGVYATISGTMIVSTSSGEKLKLMTNPLNITYTDPVSPFYGIFQFDKETALSSPVPTVVDDDSDADDTGASEPTPDEVVNTGDPLNIDFPDIK